MGKQKHTPGPWTSRVPVGPSVSVAGVAWSICGAPDADGGFVVVAEVLGTGPRCEDTAESRANGHLIAAAPDLLAELRETADWLSQRAKSMRTLAIAVPGRGKLVNECVQDLRDEAARCEGRAALIRILITKATGGN